MYLFGRDFAGEYKKNLELWGAAVYLKNSALKLPWTAQNTLSCYTLKNTFPTTMNSRMFLTGLAFAMVCGCLSQQAQAGWRDRYDISAITRQNPSAQKILDGPLGPIIDIIVEIILFLLDFILGGAFVPITRFNKLEREVASMHAAMDGRSDTVPKGV
ncbi:hypothetical protein ElyMa_001216900 [Elysia marginata]|uniref:Uncharacterized protein n=1 Tax=Elysia marginata TaxID=1093978 RepID=A0AAV4I6W4_9GAST|nr:hypothetical protein ElyMa_001216900 [Elysia marginata]